MKIFYTDQFALPLPRGHRFPIQKYALLRERVQSNTLDLPVELYVPQAATTLELKRVHSQNYLGRMETGKLSAKELRILGFPWSPELVRRSRRSSGATIEACRAALDGGISVNLAGGTHHAYSDRGEGYCVFNDSAVATNAMLAERRVECVMIIDCDVHQGNGTAAIFTHDPNVFTFSIHGEKNYPVRKERSDLDIGLADNTGDDGYLEALEIGLHEAFSRFTPDLTIFLAGADPYVDDTLGRLALTKAGLQARDRLVLDFCYAEGIPVAITMAGGYAKQLKDTVDIHMQTVSEAIATLHKGPSVTRGHNQSNT